MNPLFDELVETQRRKDQIAYADEMRKLTIYSRKRRSGHILFAPWLARLGTWLVAVGCRLQERYEAVSAPNLAVYTTTERPTPSCTS